MRSNNNNKRQRSKLSTRNKRRRQAARPADLVLLSEVASGSTSDQSVSLEEQVLTFRPIQRTLGHLTATTSEEAGSENTTTTTTTTTSAQDITPADRISGDNIGQEIGYLREQVAALQQEQHRSIEQLTDRLDEVAQDAASACRKSSRIEGVGVPAITRALIQVLLRLGFSIDEVTSTLVGNRRPQMVGGYLAEMLSEEVAQDQEPAPTTAEHEPQPVVNQAHNANEEDTHVQATSSQRMWQFHLVSEEEAREGRETPAAPEAGYPHH